MRTVKDYQKDYQKQHREKLWVEQRERDAAAIREGDLKDLKLSDQELDEAEKRIISEKRDLLGGISFEEWAQEWRAILEKVWRAGGTLTIDEQLWVLYFYNTMQPDEKKEFLRFLTERGALPPGLLFPEPGADYISECKNKMDSYSAAVDMREPGEDAEDDVDSADIGGSANRLPHANYGKNRPPLVRGIPAAGKRPELITFGQAKSLMGVVHEDVVSTRLTYDARILETRLHRRYNELPLGVRLWRAVGAGSYKRKADGCKDFLSRTGRHTCGSLIHSHHALMLTLSWYAGYTGLKGTKWVFENHKLVSFTGVDSQGVETETIHVWA